VNPKIDGLYVASGAQDTFQQQSGIHILKRHVTGQWGIGDGEVYLFITHQAISVAKGLNEPLSWLTLSKDRYIDDGPIIVITAVSGAAETKLAPGKIYIHNSLPFCNAVHDSLLEFQDNETLEGSVVTCYFCRFVKELAKCCGVPGAAPTLRRPQRSSQVNSIYHFELRRAALITCGVPFSVVLKYSILSCPYADANGEYAQEGPNDYVHGNNEAFRLCKEKKNLWVLLMNGRTACQNQNSSGAPPLDGWYYWKSAVGSYVPSVKMVVRPTQNQDPPKDQPSPPTAERVPTSAPSSTAGLAPTPPAPGSSARRYRLSQQPVLHLPATVSQATLAPLVRKRRQTMCRSS
jgi:hypothetical protein